MSWHSSTKWTEERIAALKVMLADNKSASQCGAALGVSKNAVISIVHRRPDALAFVGVPNGQGTGQKREAPSRRPSLAVSACAQSPVKRPPPMTAEQTEQASRLLAEGRMTIAQVAHAVGCSHAQASGLSTSMNLGARQSSNRVADAELQARIKRRKQLMAGLAGAPPVVGYQAERFQQGFAGQQGRVTLLELQDHHCRFPIDMPDGSLRFCGDVKEDGTSYCPAHATRAFNPMSKQMMRRVGL